MRAAPYAVMSAQESLGAAARELLIKETEPRVIAVRANAIAKAWCILELPKGSRKRMFQRVRGVAGNRCKL